jgi:hypothetical protein
MANQPPKVSVPMTPALKAYVQDQAQRQGRPVAAYIRRCIEAVRRLETETA